MKKSPSTVVSSLAGERPKPAYRQAGNDDILREFYFFLASLYTSARLSE